MRLQHPKQLVPLALGLLVLALAVTCVCVQQSDRDKPSLQLSDLTRLARPEVVLMSCADDDTQPARSTFSIQSSIAYAHVASGVVPADNSAPGPEPLWCANPDAPHCQQGTPTPSHNHSCLGPLSAFAPPPAVPPLGRAWSVSSSWPAARHAQLLSYAQPHRLERPPRLG